MFNCALSLGADSSGDGAYPNRRVVMRLQTKLKTIKRKIMFHQEAIKTLNQEFAETIARAPKATIEREASDLYWNHPEIRVTDIAKRLGVKESEFKPLKMFKCDKCKDEIIYATSRYKKDELERAHKKGDAICQGCAEDKHKELAENWKRYNESTEINDIRLRQLKTMPYKDYLQTDEWKARRTAYLKTVGYRCEVCNTNDKTLNIHHRTYKRRGNEWNKDLIALCHDCHGIFHLNSKLASQ